MPKHAQLGFFLACLFFRFHQVLCGKSYYDMLGVTKTSTDKDIKKAYRRLALKCHPDKGGDEEEFKEISKVYDCLSDPAKRQIYDTYGEVGAMGVGQSAGSYMPGGKGSAPFGRNDGKSNGNPFQSFYSTSSDGTQSFAAESFPFGNDSNIDLSQILQGMMGARNPFSSRPKRSPHERSPPQQSKSYQKRVTCTLEDLAGGITKKMKVTYQGKEKLFEIAVKPGWKEGTKVTFKGNPDYPTMVFVVHESPHKFLLRHGDDLHYTCWISKAQTNGGIQVKVPLPTGDVWTQRIGREGEPVLFNGKRMVIPSRGMPKKGGSDRGDLIVSFRIRRSSTS